MHSAMRRCESNERGEDAMKSHVASSLRPIHFYEVGDLLLELDRAAGAVPPVLNVLSGNAAQEKEKIATSIFDIAKPKASDYPALTSALQVLKLGPDDVKKYHELVGTAVNIASAVVWVVGAVNAIASVVDYLFPEKSETEKRLEHISMRVDQIYGYLAAQERKGLYIEAVDWRENIDTVRNAINNARISRSPLNLQALVARKDQLDMDLGKMLDPGRADIAFLRAVYGFGPEHNGAAGAHWIGACISPYMTLANGASINYRYPEHELKTTIWDPCHYIDILVSGLIDRLLLLATTEPAFRATYYDMEQIRNLANGLTAFINKWRASLIVANPLAGIDGAGLMHHAETSAPNGVAIGAVDPVTGVAFYHGLWAGFPYVEVWKGSISAQGVPDETRAKDPAAARAAALDLQARLLDGTIRVSGISKFVELRARLQEILTFATVGSDFVKLPNASFHLIEMEGPPAQPEQVDLGFIGLYSKNPNKKYAGQRYWQSIEKKFRFAMPVRTDVTYVQVGYRIEFGDRNLELIPFSRAPGYGTAPRFPSNPISMEIRAADWTVYDVYQSKLFRAKDENDFEGGVDAGSAMAAPFNPSGFNAGIGSLQPAGKAVSYLPIDFVSPERLFLNEKKGPVALKIDVTFESDLNNEKQPYVGHATISIRNLEPELCPGGIILPVAVYETRVVDKNGRTEEFLADRMTIHLVPSFLVLGSEYFQDRRDGMAAIDSIYGGINRKYAISDLQIIPVDPEWAVRRKGLEEVAKINAIGRFAREEPEVAFEILRNYQTPIPVMRSDSNGPHAGPNLMQFQLASTPPIDPPTA
jgi:hypothetical protein